MIDDVGSNIYNEIIKSIPESLKDFVTLGNEILKKRCQENECFILYPFVVSPDTITSHYTPNDNDIITVDTVLKIDFAIGNKNKEICYIGKTLSRNKEDASIIKFLEKLKTSVKKRINKKSFETNDELSLYLQGKCIENDCVFLENCKSFMYTDNLLFSDDSKYIICNYKKCYDKEDMLMEYNDCLDLEPDERYIVNISVTKTTSDTPCKYKTLEPGLGFFNNDVYKLKMKSSRAFYSRTKTLNGTNVFFLDDYNTASDKIGKRECSEHGILEYLYPIKCDKKVYSVKFVVNIPV